MRLRDNIGDYQLYEGNNRQQNNFYVKYEIVEVSFVGK